MSAPTLSARAWGLLLLLSLLWGGSFLFVGIAVREVPPMTLVLARVGIGGAALLALLRLRGEALPRGGAAWRDMAGMAVLMSALPFCLIVWGQAHIPAGLAAILNATTPLFGALVAHVATQDERLTPLRCAALGAGFSGVVVLMGGPAAGHAGVQGWAVLACLAASLSYGIGGVFGRRVRRHGLTPLAAASMQVGIAAILLAPLALAMDRPWGLAIPSATAIAAVLALALLSTALAYLVLFRIMALAGPGNALLVTFLIPPSAILLGWLGLGESLLPRHLAGMALIGLGLVLLDGRWRRVPVASGVLPPDALG
ncbi:DMT family transporter [Humitalea sp. 24SJ18S-53]|uniref:DMT family transporter n=1 Tax=Humitalea sp. 24SJ18S-53 TaxID=3422307 RepID=UPI003D670AC3